MKTDLALPTALADSHRSHKPTNTGNGRNRDTRSSPVCLLERGGSVVECRTRNRESPGSNPL